ncbi:MAG: DEAD/DEAH box helicase [Actinobacteria bacterium]|nr:DEAD/DEAH box helicase [Actinomycetota bacterium]MBW3651495.1 DEAD/DEAH box helicase [Actinomycetota bacterium]
MSAEVLGLLAQRGIHSAFDVQAATIPAALAGRDVCGRAPTGSGKTLAFGIPLAARVSRARPARPRALVLVPTRELASQIQVELTPMLALRKRSIATFYGGVSFIPQLKMLRRGVDVAVACPGRLADLVRRGNLILDEVELVVVDEADRMADMGFLPEVRRILDQVRPDRQTLLFSATLDGQVDVLVRHYQHDPHRVEVAPPEQEEDRTTHVFVDTGREQRVDKTAELVGRHGSAIVFCRTKHGADRLTTQLARAGVSAVAIHGNRNQAQRERALAAFAGGRVQALVATDVAARGIHVDGVGCVVHFDLPADTKDYVHRSGRTGRAGAEGMVVSFVTEGDGPRAGQLKKSLGMPVPADATRRQPSRRSTGRGRGRGPIGPVERAGAARGAISRSRRAR